MKNPCIIGWKAGMTRIFEDNGVTRAATVIMVPENHISQVKTQQKDGYSAVQLCAGDAKVKRTSKAMQGHFAKHGVDTPKRVCREFRCDDVSSFEDGATYGLDSFEEGQYVDVCGTTKGRGFAGVMRRHGFGGGRATHGNSKAHRKAGSTGQCQDPGRVWPGKKMAGHMGFAQRTVQNLRLRKIDTENRLVLVQGAIPGPANSMVIISKAMKKS